MRDPEEVLAQEAERRKKLQVGEALRGQMHERELSRQSYSQPLSRSSPELRAHFHGSEQEETVDARRVKRAELRGTLEQWGRIPDDDDTRTSNRPASGPVVSWDEHAALQQRCAQLERRLLEVEQTSSALHVAALSPPSAELQTRSIDTARMQREMATMRDDNALLNADLNEQVEFLAQLDDRQAMLAASVDRLMSSDTGRRLEPHHSPEDRTEPGSHQGEVTLGYKGPPHC
jgi:hypothetical protein